jgi:DNA/RNA-binding domain of Phe-tRNA-synthetase-like protein
VSAKRAATPATGADRPFEPQRGWCEDEVRAELPGLSLVHARATLASVGRSSPPALRRRLHELSSRWAGPHAINLRQRPVPAAYRVFFRHIGLDPDVAPTPIEEAMLGRMLQGGFISSNLLADALLIALVDTGVPVWALAAAAVDGSLGIRASRAGETLGRDRAAPALPGGRLVVADSSAALAVLFGEIAPGHAARAVTGEAILFSLQVPGVPSLHVEEALWMCGSMLKGPW